MALIYVRSTTGNDGNSGAGWATAKATIAGALAIAVAGDTIYVSQAHAETQATTMTLTSAGTAASRVRIICANDAAEPPTALATTATATTTSNSSLIFRGFLYCYGVSFVANSGGASSGLTLSFSDTNTENAQRFDSCSFRIAGTGTANRFDLQAVSSTARAPRFEFNDCAFLFSAAGQTIRQTTGFTTMRRCTFAATGTVPTILFRGPGASSSCSVAEFDGCDFTNVNTTLFDTTDVAAKRYILANCKIHASAAIHNTNNSPGTTDIRLFNTDSGNTNFRNELHTYYGDLLTETTIVRTGGAATKTPTAFSWKMVTESTAAYITPLESLHVNDWNDGTSAVTLTAHVVTDNVTLTDADCWLEVEYLGTAGTPLSLFASDRSASILATPANQATSTVDWTTTGLTTPVKQKLEVTFTPAMKGLWRAKIMLAKPSTTVYVCPRLEIS